MATQVQHTNRAYWGEIDGYRHTLELRLEFDPTNLTSGISAGIIDLYYCGWDDAEYVGESTRPRLAERAPSAWMYAAPPPD
jgi:hypothetical protein